MLSSDINERTAYIENFGSLKNNYYHNDDIMPILSVIFVKLHL